MRLQIANQTSIPSSSAEVYVRALRPRGGAVSIEVNLSPNGACPFACDYCVVPRRGARAFPEAVDLRKLESELRRALELHAGRVIDVTFAGTGEPTWCPEFEQSLMIAQACVRCFGRRPIPVRVLTCGGTLERRHVARALEALVSAGEGEVWIKFDAWDEDSYERINGARAFERATDRILGIARRVPVVLQTLVGHRPGDVGAEALGKNVANAIRKLVEAGACIDRVELTTLTQAPARGAQVKPLSMVEVGTVATEIAGVVPVRILGSA